MKSPWACTSLFEERWRLFPGLPFGKLTQLWKITIFNRQIQVNQLVQWAIFNSYVSHYQRVILFQTHHQVRQHAIISCTFSLPTGCSSHFFRHSGRQDWSEVLVVHADDIMEHATCNLECGIRHKTQHLGDLTIFNIYHP